MIEVPIQYKENLTLEEASAIFNIGKDKLRELMNDAYCPFVLINGRKKLINKDKFKDFLGKVRQI